MTVKDINLLHIRVDQLNERGPLYMEPVFSTLHSLQGRDRQFSLEIGHTRERKIAFFFRGTPHACSLAESQLYAQYPEIDIFTEAADPFRLNEDEVVISVDLFLHDPEVFPIKRHPQFDDLLGRVNVSPIAGLTSALAQIRNTSVRGHVGVILQPLSGAYRRRALRFLPLLQKRLPKYFPWYARFLTKIFLARGWKRIVFIPLKIMLGGFGYWFPRQSDQKNYDGKSGADFDVSNRSHDREDPIIGARDKINKLLYLSNVRISLITKKEFVPEVSKYLKQLVSSFRQFALPHSNSFKAGKYRLHQKLDTSLNLSPFLLSVEEDATIWHFPTIQSQTPQLDAIISRKLEPPVHLPVINGQGDLSDITTLGNAVYRSQAAHFGIHSDDRRRHVYIIGKTGMGKSTLLENMIFSDINRGHGIGVIDPHGDLVQAILHFIPENRLEDVFLFDPSDNQYSVSFNMLHCQNPDQRSLVASGLMSVFTKLWPDAWSGRMEHILHNTLLALLENPASSMLGILRMYADGNYRQGILKNVSDPLVRAFWEQEYAGWSDKYRTEAVAAIQNKIGQLITSSRLRNIIGQPQNAVDLRRAMDEGKIILVNLSKGKLGEDVSAFLGSMLVTKFQIDAMSRADVPEKERRDFYLYVDEFQNFVTPSFASILSEARKYRLSLTMANQYIGQLMINGNDTSLRDAVFGNVGTLIGFQVGSDDAEALSLQFGEMVSTADILNLPKYHAYLRLLIDGTPSRPFSMTTLPPPVLNEGHTNTDQIRERSRARYARKREEVEKEIFNWAQTAGKDATTPYNDQKEKEKTEEDLIKAHQKGMTLPEYQAWRNRQRGVNDYNFLRKKRALGHLLSAQEVQYMAALENWLSQKGGIPPMSHKLQKEIEKQKKAENPEQKLKEPEPVAVDDGKIIARVAVATEPKEMSSEKTSEIKKPEKAQPGKLKKKRKRRKSRVRRGISQIQGEENKKLRGVV